MLIERLFPRRNVAKSPGIKVLSSQGGEELGTLLDISAKGFRLKSSQKLVEGAMLKGLFEAQDASGLPSMIPFSARCVWSHRQEYGFSIKEIPLSKEAEMDALVIRASAQG